MKKKLTFIAAASAIMLIITSCKSAPPLKTTLTILDAVHGGYAIVKNKIPSKVRLAVLGFTGQNRAEAIWARDELVHILSKEARHELMDQRGLSVENGYKKITGEIEVRSAIDLGYLLGAEVILYGSISHYGNVRFLNLHAVNVLNGDVLATTTERYVG